MNISLLIIGIIMIFHGSQKDIILYDIPLYNSEGLYRDGEHNTFLTNYPEGNYRFKGETGVLESGIYDITIEYFTRQDRDRKSVV